MSFASRFRGRQTQFHIELLYGVLFVAGFAYLVFQFDPRVAAFEGGLVTGYLLRVWEKMSIYERILEEAVSREAEAQVADEVETQVADEVADEVAAQVPDEVSDEVEAQMEDEIGDIEHRIDERVAEQVGSETGGSDTEAAGDREEIERSGGD